MAGKPKLPFAKMSPSEYKKLQKLGKYKLLPRAFVGKYQFPTARSNLRKAKK